MATQTGFATSKVLILAGAGLTGSVVLSSGRLSDLLLQLQELMKGVTEAEIAPGKYDAAILATQIRQLAQEIRELTLSRPATFFNGNSETSGNLASYLVPAAAVGAMGCCYMWWKGLSFADVMFVTKQNMANAVADVSKQLERVSALLSSTKRHLSQRLEILDGKMDEQIETTKQVMNEVIEAKSDLYQIGFDVDIIQKMVSGLEGKIELVESKQDITNSGLWYLCQFAGGRIKNGENNNSLQHHSNVRVLLFKEMPESQPCPSPRPSPCPCSLDEECVGSFLANIHKALGHPSDNQGSPGESTIRWAFVTKDVLDYKKSRKGHCLEFGLFGARGTEESLMRNPSSCTI